MKISCDYSDLRWALVESVREVILASVTQALKLMGIKTYTVAFRGEFLDVAFNIKEAHPDDSEKLEEFRKRNKELEKRVKEKRYKRAVEEQKKKVAKELAEARDALLDKYRKEFQERLDQLSEIGELDNEYTVEKVGYDKKAGNLIFKIFQN